MGKYEVAGHEPSLLPEGSWEMVWADEFDGTTLDASKWDYRMSMMGLRWPSWTDKAVHLDGKSNVVFTLVEEDGKPVCSQLQTGYNFMDQPEVPTTFGKSHLQWHIGKLHESKYLHSYGYYECRCRMQQRPDAWWSAFWIQSPVIGASLNPADTGVEIDVMEYFERGVVHPHNVFTGGYGLDMSRSRAGGKPFGDLDEFHRFGLLWDETGYTFYVDGVEDGKVTDKLTTRPEFILISTEVKGYRKAEHAPVPEAFDALGDTFLVDYVRVFDRK